MPDPASVPRRLLAAGLPGAGKTTLVRRLARQARAHGRRVAIVAGERGSARIDALTLGHERLPVVPWEITGDAPRDVAELLRCVARAAAAGGEDGVLVELAGGDAPSAFAQALAAAGPAPVVVAVLDAQRLETTRDRWQPIADGADVLLLNKADARFEGDVPGLVAGLAARHPRARTLATVESTLLLEEIPAADPAGLADQAAPAATPCVCVEIPLDGPLARAVVDALVADPPEGIERVKGFLRLDDAPALHQLQVTGRSGALRRAFLEPEPAAVLAFVGAHADETALRARLRLAPISCTPSGEGPAPSLGRE